MLECITQTADIPVHARNHGNIRGIGETRGIGFLDLAPETVNFIGGRSNAEMGSHVGDIEEERGVPIHLPDVFNGVVGDQVINVAGDRHPVASPPEFRRKFLEGLVGIGEAKEPIKPLVHRMDIVVLPGSAACRAATCRKARSGSRTCVEPRQCHFFRRQVLVVPADAIVNCILAGQQGSAAGPQIGAAV